MLRVLLFGRLADAAQQSEIVLPWNDALGTPEHVRDHLSGNGPKLAEALSDPRNLVAVNQEIAGWQASLRDGDEVAFMPPVSGG